MKGEITNRQLQENFQAIYNLGTNHLKTLMEWFEPEYRNSQGEEINYYVFPFGTIALTTGEKSFGEKIPAETIRHYEAEAEKITSLGKALCILEQLADELTQKKDELKSKDKPTMTEKDTRGASLLSSWAVPRTSEEENTEKQITEIELKDKFQEIYDLGEKHLGKLLKWFSPEFFNRDENGHKYDVFPIGTIALTTGEKSFGKKIPAETIRHYEAEAGKITSLGKAVCILEQLADELKRKNDELKSKENSKIIARASKDSCLLAEELIVMLEGLSFKDKRFYSFIFSHLIKATSHYMAIPELKDEYKNYFYHTTADAIDVPIFLREKLEDWIENGGLLQ